MNINLKVSKKGDRFVNIDSNGGEILTVKCFMLPGSEKQYDTVWDVLKDDPAAPLIIVENVEHGGSSDLDKIVLVPANGSIIIQGVKDSNITINFS